MDSLRTYVQQFDSADMNMLCDYTIDNIYEHDTLGKNNIPIGINIDNIHHVKTYNTIYNKYKQNNAINGLFMTHIVNEFNIEFGVNILHTEYKPDHMGCDVLWSISNTTKFITRMTNREQACYSYMYSRSVYDINREYHTDSFTSISTPILHEQKKYYQWFARDGHDCNELRKLLITLTKHQLKLRGDYTDGNDECKHQLDIDLLLLEYGTKLLRDTYAYIKTITINEKVSMVI